MCLSRSLDASILFLLIFSVMFWIKFPQYIHNEFGNVIERGGSYWGIISGLLMVLFIFNYLPDYLSLLKGRYIIKMMRRRPDYSILVIGTTLDIVLSVIIIYSVCVVLNMVTQFLSHKPVLSLDGADIFYKTLVNVLDGLKVLVGGVPNRPLNIIYATYYCTSLMTSLWTMLILLTALLIKLASGLNPTMRLLTWMFDVDAHPIRVLGLVSAVIVWVGSIGYGLI